MTLSETLPNVSSTSSVAKHLHSRGLDPVNLSLDPKIIPSGLFLDRLTYSQKTLSYQHDALDAFRGILRLHRFITLWGIPITCIGWRINPCVGFAMGLLWIRRPWGSLNPHATNNAGISYTRRPGFPTWSWTSVIGEIFQNSSGVHSLYGKFLMSASHSSNFQMEGIRSSVRVEMPDSGISLAEAIEGAENDILPETSTSIFLEGDIVRVRRLQWLPNATDRLLRFSFCQQNDEPIL